MNYIEIAANAPTKAKYFGVIDDGPSGTELYLDGDLASCVKVWYLDDDSTWTEGDFDSFCVYGFKDFRSLSDVRRIAELENDVLKSKEIMAECWSMVGNNIDFQHGGYSTLHEHVNALKERAETAEREFVNISAKYKKRVGVIGALVSELTGKSVVFEKMRTREAIQTAINKFAIEQKINAIRAAKVKSYDTSRGLVVSVESLEDLITQLRQQLNQ
jgi:hypothetical protein